MCLSLAVLGRGRLLLLCLSFVLLMGAWVMATRPFYAPDESSHYLRALTIANGTLTGPKARYTSPGLTARQFAWVEQDTRAVVVPARLSPILVFCADGHPDVGTGSCVEDTPTGDYQPLPYLLPAIALKVAHDATTGLYLARLLSAALCAAFLSLGFALLWNGTGWSLLGPITTISPMVLFIGSIVNPSGLEVAASFAFAAAALRVARDPARIPRWVWPGLIASGAVTILSWQLGPVFVVLDLVVVGALLGRTDARVLVAGQRRWVLAAGSVLLAAFGLYLAYGAAAGLFHSTLEFKPFIQAIHAGFDQLRPILHQSVGVFGPLTVTLPPALYWIWWLLAAGLLAAGLWVGTRRERAVLGSAVVLAFAFPVLFYAWLYRGSGFPLQGRYVIPLLMLVPLLAGEVIQRRASSSVPTQLRQLAVSAVLAGAAIFQLVAWWINARAAAGLPTTVWFLAHPAWSPPGGWWPWTAGALLGAAGLVAVAAGDLHRIRRPARLAAIA